jgi:hypothetical protein
MSKPASIVLLCEDKQLSAFSRRFLKNRGIKLVEIPRPPETSGGSRKQWVTNQYPQQLKAIRQRSGAVLIVCTDADELAVERRIEDLNEACKKADIEPRKDNDPVVMVVPKWNIETWLSYLRGESFDEDVKENRRYTGYEKECKEQVQKLVDMCYNKQALQEPVPPSLKAACNEYKKVKQ